MRMGSRTSTVAATALAIFTSGTAMAFGPIPVPNGSFQSPDIPFATSLITNWQKPAGMDPSFPIVNPQNPGETEEDYLARLAFDWFNTSGVFLNTTPFIDNATGDQVGFLFGVPGVELHQELSATYQVGESYTLQIDMEGGGNMPLNTEAAIRLYYLDGSNRITIGQTIIQNNNAPGNQITHLDTYSLALPTVLGGDAWAGKNIGIQIISLANLNVGQVGGYWDLDNVILVPEPGAVAFLVAAAAGMLRRRRK